MAQLDASIFMNQQAPDFGKIGEGFERGMRLGDMMRENKIKQAEQDKAMKLKDFAKQSTVVDANGNQSLDQQSYLNRVAGEFGALESQKQLGQFIGQQATNAEAQSKIKTSVDDQIHGLIKVANSKPNSPEAVSAYKTGYNIAKNAGYNVSAFPPEYTPEAARQADMMLGTQKESVLNDIKKQESQIDEQLKKSQIAKNYAEAGKAKTEANDKVSPGEKEVDKKYAPIYTDFVNGGEQSAIDAIAKLKSYKKELEADSGFIQFGGGPIAGSMPDAVRTTKSIAIRDNIVTAANKGLKGTFGGQLSDGERKAAANEYYNDKLPNSENIKILDQKIGELENGLAVQKSMASHYGPRKTLSGFTPGTVAPAAAPKLPGLDLDFNKLSDKELEKLYLERGGK